MKIGIIGLGKMGLNMAMNLHDNGVDIAGFDVSKEAQTEAKEKNIKVSSSLDELLNSFEDQIVLLLSLPAGEITNNTVRSLCSKLNPGDIIIEAGNANYHDSVANYNLTK